MKDEVRVNVLMRGSLAEALLRESRRTLAPLSAITRAALVEYLSKRGYEVSDDLIWGGKRSTEEEDTEQGQEVAAAAG